MLQLAQQDSFGALQTITINLMINHLKVVPLAYLSLNAKICSLPFSNQDLLTSLRIWFVLCSLCLWHWLYVLLLTLILFFLSGSYVLSHLSVCSDIYLQMLNVFIFMLFLFRWVNGKSEIFCAFQHFANEIIFWAVFTSIYCYFHLQLTFWGQYYRDWLCYQSTRVENSERGWYWTSNLNEKD